ncbi:MAG: MBL fold metallo-hydrolase [Pseudomonadota bacterium]
MQLLSRSALLNSVRIAAVSLLLLVLVATTAISIAWHNRPSIDDADLAAAPQLPRGADTVTVRWLGVSNLLIDDGETQLLIDAYFTRPELRRMLLGEPVQSDAASVNTALARYRMDRLAAVIPSHSHFDHTLDLGAIANRTDAVVFGSPSSARIARGAGVPEEQLSIVTERTSRDFGQFRVTLHPSVHAPIAPGKTVPFSGSIDAPLPQPAPIKAFRAGITFTIVIEHPQGTMVVNTSAGFREPALVDVNADVVFLGTALLKRLGEAYTREYWIAMVTATGAKTVYPVHFDDYTRPLGETVLLPSMIDDFAGNIAWLRRARDLWDPDVRIYRPEFNEPIVVFPPSEDADT